MNKVGMRLKALENTHICYGYPSGDCFWQKSLPVPVPEMGSGALNHFLEKKIGPLLDPGMIILNTNLNLN
jgi:hypothetical protein